MAVPVRGEFPLPMIFVKGEPADLRKFSLVQLRKFVPFLVSCVTKHDLPDAERPDINSPSWWPVGVSFSKKSLTERLTQSTLVRRLMKIIYSCYKHHNCQFIIPFSASLVKKRLEFLDVDNGTTRVLDAKRQLVSVIRTSSRFYDDEVAKKKLRRKDKMNNSTSLVCTDFKEGFQPTTLLHRFDDPNSNGRDSVVLSSVGRKVVDDITNQLSINAKPRRIRVEIDDVPKHLEQDDLSGPPKAPLKTNRKSKKRGRIEIQDEEPEISICKYCNTEFGERYLCQEHEEICLKTVPYGNDLRDVPDRLDMFAASLGLVSKISDKNEVTAELDLHPVVASTGRGPAKENNTKKSARPSRKLRKVPARNRLVTFIKAHPTMPITSLRGQKLIEELGERLTSTALSKTPEYEAYCRSRLKKTAVPPTRRSNRTRNLPVARITKPTVFKHKNFSHLYTFGTRQRLRRNVELIVGVNSKSFNNFNKCVPVALNLEKLPEKTVREAQERENKRRLGRDVINIAKLCEQLQPFVKLMDYKKYPDAIPSKWRKKLKFQD